MIEVPVPQLIVALVAGLLLGVFNFRGLWWTVSRLQETPRPVLFLVFSFVVRMLVTLGGFYLAMQGHWQNLAVCVAAFFLARFFVVGKYRKQPATTLPPRDSSPNASVTDHEV